MQAVGGMRQFDHLPRELLADGAVPCDVIPCTRAYLFDTFSGLNMCKDVSDAFCAQQQVHVSGVSTEGAAGVSSPPSWTVLSMGVTAPRAHISTTALGKWFQETHGNEVHNLLHESHLPNPHLDAGAPLLSQLPSDRNRQELARRALVQSEVQHQVREWTQSHRLKVRAKFSPRPAPTPSAAGKPDTNASPARHTASPTRQCGEPARVAKLGESGGKTRAGTGPRVSQGQVMRAKMKALLS